MLHDENELKQAVDRLGIDTGPRPEHREALRRRMLEAFEQAQCQEPPHIQRHCSWLRRTIMQNSKTKIAGALAAAGMAAAVLIATLITRSHSSAYAIEQTLDANRTLRSMQIVTTWPPGAQSRISNTPVQVEQARSWLEFDERGELVRMREEIGPRVQVLADNVAREWRSDKNELRLREEEAYEMKRDFRASRADPRSFMEGLYQRQAAGWARIDVQESRQPGDAIVLTVVDKGSDPDDATWKYVLQIDPATKFVKQVERHRLVDGQYQFRMRQEYLHYNEPIDPSRFVLEAPAGARVVDVATGIGLAQGSMTDEQAAAETVRQFLDAMLVKDYDRAGQLFTKGKSERLRTLRQRMGETWLRVVSVGAPVPHGRPGGREYEVPYQIEIEHDGMRRIVGPGAGGEANSGRPFEVRPASNDPHRWVID